MTKWDYTTDVLVVGSGGGALTAALVVKLSGFHVIVIEKSATFGGSTALSGGGVWVPNNYLLKKKGVEDSLEKARTYMDNTVGDRVPSELKEAYILNAPEMINWLRENTQAKFLYVPNYADYHPDRPGGMGKGRALEAKPFNGRKLKGELKNLNKMAIDVPLGIAFTITEYHDLGMLMSTWKGKWTALKAGMRAVFGMLVGYKLLTLGGALIARLRKSLMDNDIPLWLNTPFEDLVLEKDKVIGVIAKKDGKEIKIKAEKGVILAAGGFAHNLEMREKYHPKPITTGWTSAHSGNTGDVILSGIKHGAATDLMDDAWWGPTSVDPDGVPFFHVGERGYPGSIIVNKAGKRFTNESASYVVVVHEMYEKHTDKIPHVPCYFIFDGRFRSKYMFGVTFPGMKFPKEFYETEYIRADDTIQGLAKKIGVSQKNLVATIERFNKLAREGKDEDFGRGETEYDNYYGDPKVKPNPNLYPLEKPPYYAVEFVAGDLGTKGGLVINEHGQVLKKNGSVIEGLYAAGNSTASVMGNSYPGPGATIGATMTFGYIAAKHILDKK